MEYGEGLKRRIRESEEGLVIATDGSRRKIKEKKQTGAGVVIKRGEMGNHLPS